MYCRRLKLINVGRHADLEINLKPGLVGIYGPNGSGKSTLVDCGLFAGLTNDYGRLYGKKSDNIRRGVEDAAISYYEAVWEHADTVFTVRRGLRPDSHKLTVHGEKPLTGATQVDKRIQEIICAPRQVLDN